MQGNDNKTYWTSLGEKKRLEENARGAGDEFAEPVEAPAGGLSRRGFLAAAGFSAAGLLAGCTRAPVDKAIPYLSKPPELTPGRASYYASTCTGCSAACGVLVKNRDGRPIKLEGNPEHAISRGGLCAAGQASILGLYDSLRLRYPLARGKRTAWEQADRQIRAELEAIEQGGGQIRLLSGTVTSPALRAGIQRFLDSYRNSRHVVYDSLSASAILDAHQRTHGARLLPHYRFERAEVIASFDTDFLGTWISPVEFTAGYRAARQPDAAPPRMSWHVQFESRMSVTGTKADHRIRVAPDEHGPMVSYLVARLARLAGDRLSFEAPSLPAGRAKQLDALAERLWQARGRSLVISGSQDGAVQVLCNFANHLLGNYGATLDLEHPSLQRQGDDRALSALVDELRAGKLGALFVLGANPVYELPWNAELAEAIKHTPLVVSLAERLDETAELSTFVCPDHHALESWGDAEPVSGAFSILQPAIRPLADTRAALVSLAAWTKGAAAVPPSAYDLLRDYWRREVFPRQTKVAVFENFWDKSVEAGYAEATAPPAALKPFDVSAVTRSAAILAAQGAGKMPALQAYALVLYPSVGLLDGRHSYNPWLQELPDPVTKVAWDNYASLSPATAAALNVADGDFVRLTGRGNRVLELPAFTQPGQHDAVVAVALGYGSRATERFADAGKHWIFGRTDTDGSKRVGSNAAPFIRVEAGTLQYVSAVSVATTGRSYKLAATQEHHSLAVPRRLSPGKNEPRPIVQEVSLTELAAGKHPGAPAGEKQDLWPADHPYTGHKWGMVVDLSACTGCSACVIACQVENNIPVVGKDEMRRRRQMHWIRLDRYYSEGEGEAAGEIEVAHQPMMCVQCDNATCETVCPVLATVHSSEGLNQQVYNRCVGTRYCANNCAYKARRFNWFEYPRDDRLANLVLNPDVTVRSRGVMEKCTFCVQRIQEAKIEAKRRDRPLADGEIQPACQQSCPAQAIVFGDLNDPNSAVSRLMKSGRGYRVLEELNVRPAVTYLKIVRQRDDAPGATPAAESRRGETHG